METVLKENLPHVISFSVTIVFTLIVVFLVKKFFNRFIKKLATEDGEDVTNYTFIRYIAIALTYTIGFLMAMYTVPVFRTIGSTLLAGAGVAALAISFASQQALSNIVSGLFIVIFKPFRINDQLQLKSRALEGVVEDITLRHTVIRDYENRRIIVPNAVISDEVIINADYKDSDICKRLDFGISYDSDIDLAKSIIYDEAIKHELHFDHRTAEEIENGKPVIVVRVVNLGDSSVDLRAWIWTRSQGDSVVMSCELMERIKKRFDKEGIEIPFPHRTIVNKLVSR